MEELENQHDTELSLFREKVLLLIPTATMGNCLILGWLISGAAAKFLKVLSYCAGFLQSKPNSSALWVSLQQPHYLTRNLQVGSQGVNSLIHLFLKGHLKKK